MISEAIARSSLKFRVREVILAFYGQINTSSLLLTCVPLFHQYYSSNVYITCSIHRELLVFYRYLQIPHKSWHQPSPYSCTVPGQTCRGNKALILIKLSSMKSIKNFWCQIWVQTASVDLRGTMTDCGN